MKDGYIFNNWVLFRVIRLCFRLLLPTFGRQYAKDQLMDEHGAIELFRAIERIYGMECDRRGFIIEEIMHRALRDPEHGFHVASPSDGSFGVYCVGDQVVLSFHRDNLPGFLDFCDVGWDIEP